MPHHSNKDVLQCNRRTAIKIRKLTWTHHYRGNRRLHLSFASCPNYLLYSKKMQFRMLCCTELSCFFSLLHYGTVTVSLTFMTLALLKVTDQLFCRNPFIWVCLPHPHDSIDVWQEIMEVMLQSSQDILASDFHLSHSWGCMLWSPDQSLYSYWPHNHLHIFLLRKPRSRVHLVKQIR